ncbi:ATP-dependent sacrificial sulfur transferase LarE [Desulfofustis limnaeus]|jgi:uncharacterized protein|uniref:Adenine nucleotide alpha hydrolase n=1 Tax=Desulfofustis limnaeus TaxID=2740163 RepID=A0ABM7W8G0_9BACT|nr:ATP-dependent sacrificial sulfur transferase LarE [Desulfofustis limnaeus]MDX9895592.1 ATP-dependent sacrificial sulfur transferase LarE [Desulfofustis sp.]BDD87180.1 adenine nucleotide alpha hydrolase [Desulfofustis limnaeus]
MNRITRGKLSRLRDYFQRLPAVAVAYSGGVDSTLAGYVACLAKGVDQVLLLLADSCLLAERTRAEAERVVVDHFPDGVRFLRVHADPLALESLQRNDRYRCYHCKSLIYRQLFAEAQRHGITMLVDGTNVDDLSDDRPGLKAAREMGVLAPLAEIGFTKKEIREAAASFALPNAHLPAESCLATRIPRLTPLAADTLRKIEQMEDFLAALGFAGFRVRMQEDSILLHVSQADWSRLADHSLRTKIITYFRTIEVSRVSVDLCCRR